MKNQILLLITVVFVSCNSNYKNAVEYYNKAKNTNSQQFLDDAKFELDLISISKKNDEKIIYLTNKINALQNKFDSISELENIKRIEYQNSELIYKIKKEKKKEKEARNNKIIESKIYPNMIGKWRTYQTDYLKILNGIVRIYKKNGVYYTSTKFEKDGSEYTNKLRKSGNRFYEIGKSDYVVIKSNGDLEHRDKEGYLMTSKKFDESFIPTIKKLTQNIIVVDIIGKNIFKFRFEYGLEDFETIEGTNNQNWITYYPKYDLTIISNKKTDIIEKFKFGK
jgi:hypothetical protein